MTVPCIDCGHVRADHAGNRDAQTAYTAPCYRDECKCWDFLPDENVCTCGHALERHDMGHGCIECRCRGFRDAS